MPALKDNINEIRRTSNGTTSNGMFKLLDRAFWRFLSGFVLILIVSFSLLTFFGVWREARENYSQLIRVFQRER
ncbi:MAG TPA: hypothetical protein DEF00_00930 [Candidatus Taylorbacteria bacterium]|nr:hypothetical protein [Candidatus Taylorbacteria bacterium]